MMYGQAGIAQHLHIGKQAVILAKSGVRKNLKGKEIYFSFRSGKRAWRTANWLHCATCQRFTGFYGKDSADKRELPRAVRLPLYCLCNRCVVSTLSLAPLI